MKIRAVAYAYAIRTPPFMAVWRRLTEGDVSTDPTMVTVLFNVCN